MGVGAAKAHDRATPVAKAGRRSFAFSHNVRYPILSCIGFPSGSQVLGFMGLLHSSLTETRFPDREPGFLTILA